MEATGMRVATIGAVNPPIDWATRTMSSVEPTPAAAIAATTASAYSGKPAVSSSQGRSTATQRCPAATSSGSTRCQYQESDAAPGIRTKVAINLVDDDGGADSSVARARPSEPGHVSAAS